MNDWLTQKIWHKGGTNEQTFQKAEKYGLALIKVSQEMKMPTDALEDLIKMTEEFLPLPIPTICLTKSQAQHMLTCEYCNKLAFNFPSAAATNPVPAACLRKDAAQHLSECDRCKKLMFAFKVKVKVQKEIESP